MALCHTQPTAAPTHRHHRWPARAVIVEGGGVSPPFHESYKTVSETLCSPFPPGSLTHTDWLAPSSPDPVHGAGGDHEFGTASQIRRFDFAPALHRLRPDAAEDRQRLAP